MFSRGSSTTIGRPLAVWAAVTIATTASVASAPGVWEAAQPGGGTRAVVDLLVAVCATGLALALLWLWAITTATVAELLAGRVGAGGGATRRLVLVACGVAVVAGTTVPALAAGGDGPELLVGLALPDRAVAPARHHPHPNPAPTTSKAGSGVTTYVVRPGDSLWSIARLHPDGTGSVDRRWRSIWEANRDLVGNDPDLIIPGQALRLPTIHTQDPSSDGDRR